MCGIAGFVSMRGQPADARVLQRMTDVQRHRGPDDQGFRLFSLASGTSREFVPANLPAPDAAFTGGIGFNRLSILDLSAHGHQPMVNADGTVLLAYNGEVYNAFDYTAELEAAGFQFRSRTDTEVILYLYERYGLEGMLARLNGMFALVLVDLRKREVLVARDHLGIKPFYWWSNGNTLLFSSEVKSFLQHPEFRAELAVENLDEYLAFRYCAGEGHLLRGVRQLRPGHELRLRDGQVAVQRYWHVPEMPLRSDVSFGQAIDVVDRMLRRSVERQLLSDVKVGCQLSGGIDSSLVTLFARSHFDANMETFSVIFDDPRYSEEKWIAQAATSAHAVSHRFTLTPDIFLQDIVPATWHLDQPLNHPNSLGIYLLAKRAKEYVTVLLSGEGADEVFAGYARFHYASLHSLLGPWVPLLRHAFKAGPKLARIYSGGRDGVLSYLRNSLFQQPGDLQQLRPCADFDAVMQRRRAIFAEGHSDHVGNCLKYCMQTYLPDLLVRQDKMCMAHSLENRVPFLDRELVEFARSIPSCLHVRSRLSMAHSHHTKLLVKALAARTFPDSFVYRPKCGFSLPLGQYFATPAFSTWMEESLLPGMARRGLVQADVVRRWWRELPQMRAGMDETLWIPIALEIWAQQFLDGRSGGVGG